MCFISSTIPEAETVKLKALGDKFKYLEYVNHTAPPIFFVANLLCRGDEKNEIYLTTALVECTNKGEEAFEIAKGSMEAINEGAKNIADVVCLFLALMATDFDTWTSYAKSSR